MKKIISLVGSLLMILLPLTVVAVTSQSNSMDAKTTWLGGPVGGISSKVQGATVDDITSRAAKQAVLNEQPVQYKAEDGHITVEAYPDYGKSKCELVHEKKWEGSTLTQSKIIEVCNRNYELSSPYAPSIPVIPHIGSR